MAGKQGFTLIELSIVLVIIALIIGGVITGQSLLRASRLNGVLSEYASYTQAIGNFRDKYQALPGDFSTATSLWAAAAGNGNGDGQIVQNVAGTQLSEQFLAWDHLSRAQMIEGSYTGATYSGSRDRFPGTNVPASKLSGAGWGLISVTLYDLNNGYTVIPYTAPDLVPNHVLWLGGRSVSNSADSQQPVMTPAEAYQLDGKADDGQPGIGKIVAQANGATGTCSTSSTAYNTSGSGNLCALVFKTGY